MAWVGSRACQVGQRTLLKDFVGVGNWKSYIAEMSQHGRTWGDEATLLAASVLFRAEICVISSLSEVRISSCAVTRARQRTPARQRHSRRAWS